MGEQGENKHVSAPEQGLSVYGTKGEAEKGAHGVLDAGLAY